MKVLFAATGSIAVPTLEKLNEMGLVRAVLTTLDERGGRGGRLIEPPIKIKARELGIECYQMESLRTEARNVISKLGCDTLLSFCYGKIFGPKFLSLFEHKYNIHPSLLPKYRGCAPLYESIRNLDRLGGISIQEIALEVDSGAILKAMTFPLEEMRCPMMHENRWIFPTQLSTAMLSSRCTSPSFRQSIDLITVSIPSAAASSDCGISGIASLSISVLPCSAQSKRLFQEALPVASVAAVITERLIPCVQCGGDLNLMAQKRGEVVIRFLQCSICGNSLSLPTKGEIVPLSSHCPLCSYSLLQIRSGKMNVDGYFLCPFCYSNPSARNGIDIESLPVGFTLPCFKCNCDCPFASLF